MVTFIPNSGGIFSISYSLLPLFGGFSLYLIRGQGYYATPAVKTAFLWASPLVK